MRERVTEASGISEGKSETIRKGKPNVTEGKEKDGRCH